MASPLTSSAPKTNNPAEINISITTPSTPGHNITVNQSNYDGDVIPTPIPTPTHGIK